MTSDFGERLRTARKEAGMSQAELAREVGVSQNALSAWESGAALPNEKYLTRLRELFPNL